MDAVPPGHRSGFVGIVGRPNVGKSTMLNYYLGEKVAIVSPRPQTTLRRTLGVLTRPDAQFAFLDAPGFYPPRDHLGRSMQESAKAVLDDADVLVVVIDGTRGLTTEDARLFEAARSTKGRRLLVINKVDAVKKPQILPLLDECAKTGLFEECIPVSAKTGEQMEILLQCIVARLPEGPQLYEPDQRTDQTTTQRIGELVREQVMIATRQEVPHAVAVLVEQVEEQPKVTMIHAALLVEREGQKAILIGRGGGMLKRIGQAARQELERLLGRQVYLQLWVKVSKDWRSDDRLLRELGYQG